MNKPTTLCIDYKDLLTEESPVIDSVQYPDGTIFEVKNNPEHERDKMILAALSHIRNTEHKKGWKHLSEIHNFHYTNLQSHLVTHRTKSENILFVSGNPFQVLHYTHMRSGEKYYLQKNLEEIISQGFHVTGIGYKQQYHSDIYDNDVHGLQWLGALRAELKIKKDIDSVLKKLREQHISLRIFSSEPLHACRAVAKKIGIQSSHEVCVTGTDIQSMNDTEVASIIPHTILFAELNEIDKIRLTRLLEDLGEVVAQSYGEYSR
ncbi:MAG TPA: hypothetical protein VLG69_05260 [Candidatus Andersenbacteria bacterium]|nr:hypothetical protein [Candidatus Andersenbacteria bacterium]